MVSNQKRFLANVSWMVGGQVVQMVISLVVGMITARYLGPSNYGVLNYCASYIAFFDSLCTLGLNGIIVKEMVLRKDQQGQILGTAIALRCISSFISIIALAVIMMIMESGDLLLLIVAVLQSIALFFNAFTLIDYWYQAQLKSKYSAVVKNIAYVLTSLYKIVLLILKKDVRWFAFAISLDAVLIAILLLWSYKKNNGSKLSFSKIEAKILLSQSYHYIIAGIMISLYGQMDKIMLGKMMGQTEVGLYSVAVAISGLWSFIPSALIDSARPVITVQRDTNHEFYIKRIKQLYSVIIWLSIAFAIVVSLFGKLIVHILYGDAYLEAVPALIIVCWYCGFSYLGSAKGIWMINENKMKYEKYFTFWGALCNLVLNYILIPYYGIVGAAVATLICQVLTNFVVPLIYKPTRINSIYMVQAFCLRGVFDRESLKNMVANIKFIGKH